VGGSTGGGSTGGTAQSCSICGSDKNFNNEKSWDGAKVCALLDTSLKAIPAGAICDSTKETASLQLDMASFCECEGAVPPGVCKACDDNQEVSTTATIPGSEGLLSCSAYAEYVENLKGATECSAMVTDAVKAACCVDKSAASAAIGLSMNNFAMVLLVGIVFAF